MVLPRARRHLDPRVAVRAGDRRAGIADLRLWGLARGNCGLPGPSQDAARVALLRDEG